MRTVAFGIRARGWEVVRTPSTFPCPEQVGGLPFSVTNFSCNVGRVVRVAAAQRATYESGQPA